MVLVGSAAADDSVVNSKHDLSARGPGPVRAVGETEICIFCHAPHNAAPQTPLWNRENPRTHYRIYQSSTTDARINQPSGPSKMCLSCHDGSMALGNVLSRPESHPIVMTSRTIPPGTTDLTNDLSDDHPIGFRYDRALSTADRQIKAPEVVSVELPLGAHGEMHCTTCHDAHNNELGDFLRVSDRMAAICTSCHAMTGWAGSSHAISPQATRGRAVDPSEPLKYTSVEENACLSCHKVHSAAERERLLRHSREEDGCLNCHDGSIARFNIAADIGKRSGHDGRRFNRVHDAAETALSMRRHVECADCHNPHAVQHAPIGQVGGSFGPTVKGTNLNVQGVTTSGRETRESDFLYEICLKCHGDSLNQERQRTQRQVDTRDLRRALQTSNPSFHPVFGPRRADDVPSLDSPMRAGSLVTCTDCHNSDNARALGGSGPNGPHGSIYDSVLAREYTTSDFTVESAAAYSLCYECHSRDSILGDESFSLHRLHVVDQRTPCSVCHDAHGVPRGGAGSGDHSHLINFDLAMVTPSDAPNGRRIEYRDQGRFAGTCTLTCHGVSHVNYPYVNAGR
jgi:predicted CXXCH cytochrome family protein